MTEQDLADQFGQDVDDLLRGHCPDRVSASREYRQALDVAQVLASTDLSAESPHRVALRYRLTNEMRRRQRLAAESAPPVAARFMLLVRHAAALLGAILALSTIYLAWSGDLHRGATDLSAALRETWQSAYAGLRAPQLSSPAAITTEAGLAASSWPMLSASDALATTQVPANSTTVALASLIVFESPPK